MSAPTVRRSPRRHVSLAASLLLPLAGGCATARMDVDPQLVAAAPEQPVEGLAWAQLRRPVKFSGYTGQITKGGWTKTETTKAGPYQREEKSQNFQYSMDGAAASWSGSCSYGQANQSVLFPISDEAGLVCIFMPQGGQGWQIQLGSKGGMYTNKTLAGSMTNGTTTLAIAMSHQLAGSSWKSSRPVGYELRDAGGKAVAAVQIFSPAMVWIDPTLPAEVQTAIAAGAFGLLFSSGAAGELNE